MLVVIQVEVTKKKLGEDIAAECMRSIRRKWRECLWACNSHFPFSVLHFADLKSCSMISPRHCLLLSRDSLNRERIRRMQRIFNQEKKKYKSSYEKWRDNGPDAYQHFQQDDWYWNTNSSYGDKRTNFGSHPWENGNFMMSHHYSVLGLDRSRETQFTDAEIKTAFRAKAMKYHPDQNPDNKEVAEAKFKEVMASYEAIKLDRKNEKC